MMHLSPTNKGEPLGRIAEPMKQEEVLALLEQVLPESGRNIPSICNYLRQRESRKLVGDESFGAVFAVTPFCNLRCKHCAISARYRATGVKEDESAFSTGKAVQLMDKIRAYADKKHLKVFFMFGGGEPTLRSDIIELVQCAASIFGKEHVGLCTNGTFREPEEILSLANRIRVLEVSVDGFEEYHNEWRDPRHETSVGNPYKRAMELVKTGISLSPQKLEVASVVTTQNMDSLPDFARFLRGIGVVNYSVHRPMPIGRMMAHRSLIPDAVDFLRFFASMADVGLEDEHFSIHLHHSLESIYSSLLLGRDIHRSNLPMGSSRHSIGLSWDGSVHFDPWSMVPPFASLSPGNLLREGVELEDLWDKPGSILNLIAEAKKANVRCRQCRMNCTGGMRLVAMADVLLDRKVGDTVSAGELMAAVSGYDPACPLRSG